MSQGGTVAADKGIRGARLGQPFNYRWVDQQPTSTTWADLANKRASVWGLVSFAVMIGIGWATDSPLLYLFGLWLMPIFAAIGWGTVDRQDVEPVPRAVEREAFIEYANDEFYFVLLVDSRLEIYQPWKLVRTFETAEYWAIFGDAGASPHKTGWHTIIMTPEVGAPWCIMSTIEAMTAVRERHSYLNAKFGAIARETFLKSISQATAHDSANEASTSEVPASFD